MSYCFMLGGLKLLVLSLVRSWMSYCYMAFVAPIGKVFPKSPDLPREPDETLDLTTVCLSDKHNLLFPVVGDDRIPSRPMDYKKGIGMVNDSSEPYHSARNLPELPGLPGERRGQKTTPNTEPPVFCLKGEGQRLPSFVVSASKIENSPGGVALKHICSQLHSWFETLSGHNLNDAITQDELKRLLYIKKMRIYLEVRKKTFGPEVHCVPIFHCPYCLEYWTITGWAPENCTNDIQPTRGPEVIMYGTKMRFISMYPKHRTNTSQRRQDYSGRKIGISNGSSRSSYTSSRYDTASEPLQSSITMSRAFNYTTRDNKEAPETTEGRPSPKEVDNSSGGTMHGNLSPGLDETPEEGTETTRCGDADDLEKGIPKSNASISLIPTISLNDDHYNEYARSTSKQNGKMNEWRKKGTSSTNVYPDNTKNLGETPQQIPLPSAEDEDKTNVSHQEAALTPLSNNDSKVEGFGATSQEDFAEENRFDKNQTGGNTSEAPDNIVEVLQPTFVDSQDLSFTVQNNLVEIPEAQRTDQFGRKQAEENVLETDNSTEKQETYFSSLDNEKLSTDQGIEVVLVNSTSKKIDSSKMKYPRRPNNNIVTWNDRRASRILNNRWSKVGNQISSLEGNSHFDEASKALGDLEERNQRLDNHVTKRYMEKSRPEEVRLTDITTQETARPKPTQDSVTSSRDINTSTDDRSSSKKPQHFSSSKKISLAIEGSQESLVTPHRRKNEFVHKKERKGNIRRPKLHAPHSKDNQALIKPNVVKASTWFEGRSTKTLNTKDASENYIYSPAVVPSVRVHKWVKEKIEDDFSSVAGDLRNDIEVVDLEFPVPVSPTVQKGNQMEDDDDDDDDDDDEEIFEEIDSKTALFSKSFASEIHRLPVSNAFTFSFYALPSQYKIHNKKLESTAFKTRSGVRRKSTI